jgi:hypothetical protein
MITATAVVKPATARQLGYLKALALQTGTSFTYPSSSRQASSEIERLRALKGKRGVVSRWDAGERAVAREVEREQAYSPAVREDEPVGFGSATSWRKPGPATPARRPAGRASTAEATGADADRGGDSPQTGVGCAARRGRVLARFTAGGQRRAVLLLPRGDGSRLLLDVPCRWPLRDARVLAALLVSEPDGNADAVCREFLANPRRCRRLAAGELDSGLCEEPVTLLASERCPATLRDAAGHGYGLRVLRQDGLASLRWARLPVDGGEGPVLPMTVRDVVGALEDYEPVRSITLRAIDNTPEGASLVLLLSELDRLLCSPFVLNRGLREAVAAAAAVGVSRSEIARRCGRLKRDPRGTQSGETSWLARRIGEIPEAGANAATPWVSSDVLALIARNGLGAAPHEVEVPAGSRPACLGV